MTDWKFKENLSDLKIGDVAVLARFGGCAGAISFARVVPVKRVTKTQIVVKSPFMGKKEITFMLPDGVRHEDDAFYKDRIIVGQRAAVALREGRAVERKRTIFGLLDELLTYARDPRNSLEDVERRLVKVYHTLGLDRVAEHQNSGEEQTDAD